KFARGIPGVPGAKHRGLEAGRPSSRDHAELAAGQPSRAREDCLIEECTTRSAATIYCLAPGRSTASGTDALGVRAALAAARRARTSARVFCSRTSRLIFSIASQAR